MIFWYVVSFKVNYVSRELQGKTKNIDAGTELFVELLSWLRIYGEEGFNGVLICANESAEAVELPLEFRKLQDKKIRRRKRMFLYKAEGQLLDDPKEAYRVQCFYLVLDQAIQSLESTFEQIKNHVKLFGFLNNFQNIHTHTRMAEIRKHTLNFEAALTVITMKHDAEGEIATETHKVVDENLLVE